MKKINKKQKLIGAISIVLILIILAIIITTNIISNNNQVENEKYLSTTANAGSNLIAKYIKNGVTIGGITGTFDVLDTSDATAIAEDIIWGKSAYVNGEKITGTYVPSNDYTFIDSLGNQVKVPGGFGVVNPEDNVEDGIIIEDVSAKDESTKGNQFVWIPIGNIETKNGPVTIDFGRYEFNTNTGVPTLKQSADNWSQEVTLSLYCTEGSSNGNAIAKNLSDFITKTKTSRGYYIGRYEAGDATATEETGPRTENSGISNQLVIKSGVYPYNWIGQKDASTKSRNLYTGNGLESDLVNSYAWDTALVFIQKCSGDEDYSIQNSQNTNIKLELVGESKLVNAEEDYKLDKRCNIFDMTGNVGEWSTETRSTGYAPVVSRGGEYNTGYTAGRWGNQSDNALENGSFRVILYL